MENTIFKFLGYSLKLIPADSEPNKKHLMFHVGCYYLKPTIDELLELRYSIDNTISNYENVNNYIDIKNEETEEKYFRGYKPNKNEVPKEIKIKSGTIYIAKCNLYNYYKIGMSIKNVDARISQLKTSNPTLELIKTFDVKDVLIEKEIHKNFDSKKIRGEWFELSKNDLKEIYCYILSKN